MGVYLFLIKNKNIIITGTSEGIGKKLVSQFIKNKNNVWGCSRKKNTIKYKNYKHTKLNLKNTLKIKKWIKNINRETKGKIDR